MVHELVLEFCDKILLQLLFVALYVITVPFRQQLYPGVLDALSVPELLELLEFIWLLELLGLLEVLGRLELLELLGRLGLLELLELLERLELLEVQEVLSTIVSGIDYYCFRN